MCTLLSWQTKVITIYDPSLETYQELQKKFSTSFTCPCSTAAIPYKNFLVTKTAVHQICSSDFVSQEWINALYRPDASIHGAIDFRTTANSQFQLLKTICRLARNNIFDALSDLNNTQLLTARVLPKTEVYMQTQVSSERIRTDTLVHFNDALKLIELSTRGSRLASALNTNYVILVNSFMDSTYYVWYNSYTSWYWTANNQTTICRCEQSTCTFPAGFYHFADIDTMEAYGDIRPQLYNISDFVPGFVGSCTPLEALLQATFVCLYDKECIKKLVKYFPQLTQVRIIYIYQRNIFEPGWMDHSEA
jgi:hypothetical protein